jgi:hypothetical protein
MGFLFTSLVYSGGENKNGCKSEKAKKEWAEYLYQFSFLGSRLQFFSAFSF